MDPAHWRQIEELYHATLELEPNERAAFLGRADPELRREVETLLDDQSGPEGPAAGLPNATVTRLTPGTQLGPYKIEAMIGAGGMGEVFRATDTRLGRHVAIKTSSEQ